MRRALLLVMLLAGPAWADDKDKGPNKEGEYGGVIPGQAQRPDRGAKPGKPKRPPAKGTLSWIGFEAKDGGAQVFFQSVAPFEVTQRVEGATLIVHLSLTKLGTNTWRQVDTRYFDNPLSMIRAKAVRAKKGKPAGVDVAITFKNPKDAREGAVRQGNEADGMSYVYLTFPEGTELPKPVGADDVEK